MSGYDIFLSSGNLLTTVNVKTVDEKNNSSLFLIGQGIPNYGTMIAQDLVWIMENFSANSAPVYPLTGQQWHDLANNQMKYYTGSEWLTFLTTKNSATAGFSMLGTATAVDFTVAATVPIFTGIAGKKYYASFMLLVPNGTVTVSTMPTFNVHVTTPGDIVASMTLSGATASKFVRAETISMPAIISGVSTAKIQITGAATGGQLKYDAYLFGLAL